MAIEIRETFQLQAPIDVVWRFVMDPKKVVTCMPGAALEEVVDETTFLGKVKVKLGAVTTSYRGKVRFTEIDETGYRLQMVAEGRETSGGTARGTMTSSLRALPDGGTELVAEATVDLTGRVMQVGRGMIQGVSHQIFQQFVKQMRARLDQPASAVPGAAPPLPAETAPVSVLPLVLKAILQAILSFFRRVFGRTGG